MLGAASSHPPDRVGSMSTGAPLSKPAELVEDHIDTPALDDRSYRVIRLQNKLEALLVHDPETDKASAALDVNVGSFSDRDDMPGMAHAVEHLLFMGTEKYPVENAYSQYLASHSGYSNAYTAATSTNYFFEVAAKPTPESGTASPMPDETSSAKPLKEGRSPLYGALDRFAQFFISPLFLSSTLDRELQAVDSENKKNLQSDVWRLYQLSKSTSNPRHSYCHFSTGNLNTLRDGPRARGVDIRKEFMDFHKQHYSANRMKLVVLGREPLDELESWVAELFSAVRNKDLPRNRWDSEQLLTKTELLTQCCAKPVMDTRLLEITFPFLDEEDYFESQPARYASHLIGHEGPGSILAYIKSRGWAAELSAGGVQICPGSGMFEISIRLTEEGLKNYRDVVKTVFHYISLIKESPPQEWIVDEMRGLAEVDFRFKQKSPASKFTSKISSVMQKPIPRAWLLSGSSLIRKFDPQAISKGLDYLRPDNFRLRLVSHDFKGLPLRERWYGTEYQLEDLPKDFLAEISKAGRSTSNERPQELALPHKNNFIPSDLGVDRKEVKDPLKAPTLIRNDESVRVWWKKDDRFWVPKGNVFIKLRNPLAYATPNTTVKTGLFCELVTDALAEYSYDADLAGLSYKLSNTMAGLRISISGYNHKMPVLLEKVLDTMMDLEIKPDRFDVVKEHLLEEYQNWEYIQPYQQVGEYSSWLDSERRWINEQYLTELQSVSASDLRGFASQLFRQLHVETLVHGNFNKEDALHLANLVEARLKPRPLPQSQWDVQRSLIVPEGSNVVYPRSHKDPANVNHCIEYILYVGQRSDPSLRAKLLLFAQTAEEPAFDQLRTKEQLGYVVFTGLRMASTTMGYRIIVQSERSPEYLESRINAFLDGFASVLRAMSEEDFESHKRSIINRQLEKLKNLAQESQRFWSHISNEYFHFTQAEDDVGFIEPLSKADVIDFFDKYIRPTSKSRSKLSVHMHAQATMADLLATEPLGEQHEMLLSLLEQYLTSQGITVNSEQLKQRFATIELSQRDPDAIVSAVEKYLVTDVGLSEMETRPLLERGQATMRSVLPSLDKTLDTNTKRKSSDGLTNGTDGRDSIELQADNEAVIIENVHDFKSTLAVTPGPIPVKGLSEYEESESKL